MYSEYSDYYEDYLNGDFGFCQSEKYGAHFLPPLYVIFFILGLLGNSLVIWVITCGVRLRSMTDVCLLNLAIADLLLVCPLPFLAHQEGKDQWHFGDTMCKMVLGTYQIAFYCGNFFICQMSIDRYLAIVHPGKARTRLFGIIAVAGTWVAGFDAFLPDLIFLKHYQTNVDKSNYCYPEYPQTYSDETYSKSHFWKLFCLFQMNILGLFIPLFIMSFCYSQIIWRLMSIHSSRKQAIRIVVAVVMVFFCCWVPYNMASLMKALELLHVIEGCENSKAIHLALQVTEAIAYSHSCLNPILYVFVWEKFRRHLLKLINRTPCMLCRVIKLYLPQDRITSVYSQTTSVDERSIGL
ncbi:C-C chemokine receptor type 5-like [Cololabis saira]|uniref:C-C chemokine receptor type 5-like n=1 Tax=Cololabis saira TaxID=129043 RepID=UPI002AD3FB92|nr:C-C chemokine receptor type 5-like [Cololabis saira]